MRDFRAVRRLPTLHAAAIGRVMARWSYEEWLLAQITDRLLNADPMRGRLRARAVRVEDQVAMIEDLIRVRGLRVKGDFAGLKRALRQAKSQRDQLAHGLWLRHAGTRQLHLWDRRGRRLAGAKGARAGRRAGPQAVRKTARDIRAVYRDIDRLITATRALARDIRAAMRAAG